MRNLNELTDVELVEYHRLYAKAKENSGRIEQIKRHGMDTKFLYHVARLADECMQILTLGDLDLQRSKEYMKAIRRGEVSEEELRDWFAVQELSLEKAYSESKLPYAPNEAKIKAVLLQCLEHHYGSLDKLGYVAPDAALVAIRSIGEIVDRILARTSTETSTDWPGLDPGRVAREILQTDAARLSEPSMSELISGAVRAKDEPVNLDEWADRLARDVSQLND